ncbi:MAG: hypothetical protein J6112_06345 [Clostridia bacterium]|nr:hypothetical protein [Clostridia bacterium]
MSDRSEKRQVLKILGSFAASVPLGILAVFAILVYFNSTFGWFANNRNVSGNNMQVALETYDYELLIDARNNNVYDDESKYFGITAFKTMLTDTLGYSLTALSTHQADKLAFELKNEHSYTEDTETYWYLTPGAYGSLTFYVRPHDSAGLETDMKVTTACFTAVTDGSTTVVREVLNENVNELLRGHLLFFRERTGTGIGNYVYDSLITDETIHFDTSDSSTYDSIVSIDGENCYKVVLYWEWPLTYGVIRENMSTSTETKRFPEELSDYIEDNREFFFETNVNSNDPEDLNDGYNDGDQLIGEKAHQIAVFISPTDGM